MMFSKDPNAFEHFHPRLRRYLLDASRKLLTALGMAGPITGNPLSNPISKMQLNNPALRRLYENYGKARAIELDEKGNLAKDGILITILVSGSPSSDPINGDASFSRGLTKGSDWGSPCSLGSSPSMAMLTDRKLKARL